MSSSRRCCASAPTSPARLRPGRPSSASGPPCSCSSASARSRAPRASKTKPRRTSRPRRISAASRWARKSRRHDLGRMEEGLLRVGASDHAVRDTGAVEPERDGSRRRDAHDGPEDEGRDRSRARAVLVRDRAVDASRSGAHAAPAQPAPEPAVRSRGAAARTEGILVMDVSHLTGLAPAPQAVFQRLPTHRHRARFHVRSGTAWTPVTWGQFATQIRGVARWLIEHDLEPGDRVAIFAQNSVAWASASLGVQTAGAVFVPIYPASTPEQVAYILEHAEIKYVFVAGKECIARLEKARSLVPAPPQVVDLDTASWSAGAPVVDESSIRAAAARDEAAPALVDARLGALDLDQPAQMLYTSGTSGNPKGVPLTHRNVGRNGVDWLVCNAPLLAEGDRDLLWLPMSHIFGFGELCAGNLLGWETYMASPADVLDLLPGVAPQVFMSVPAYWEKLARAIVAGPGASEDGERGEEARKEALRRVTGGRLRFCLSGGAGLKVEIKQLLHRCGVLIIEGYGLTETS